MPLPRWVARFNNRWTNRFMLPLAKTQRGFAVVHHVGRKSGRTYSTPINLFGCDGGYLVALTYGPGADWYRNVLAGPARLELGGRCLTIEETSHVNRAEAIAFLPLFVRIATRLIKVTDFALLRTRPASTTSTP